MGRTRNTDTPEAPSETPTETATEAAPAEPAKPTRRSRSSKSSRGPKTHVGERKLCTPCAGNGQKDGARCEPCGGTGWHGGNADHKPHLTEPLTPPSK